MLNLPYKSWVLAAMVLLLPPSAFSAGLGKLTILSALGQPLAAEIDLVSVQKDELSSLAIRMASPDTFTKANIIYSPALIGARLSIEKRGDGQPYVKITSSRSVSEPFISVLVELSWSRGRLVREYTALIDPPSVPSTAAVAPVASPVVAPTAQETAPVQRAAPAVAEQQETKEPKAALIKSVPAEKSKAVTPAPVKEANANEREYGPVKRGDTLARIAAAVKPDGITLEQTLVGLYKNNPEAFSGDMNRLKSGQILRIPDTEKLAEILPQEAAKEIRVQAANWNAYRQKVADAAGDSPATESRGIARGKIAPVDDKAAAKEVPKEVVKLAKGEADTSNKKSGKGDAAAKDKLRALEDDAVAREKALVEANTRIAQLEKSIKEMQRLMELKGSAPGSKPEPAKAESTKAAPVQTEATKEVPKSSDPVKDAAKVDAAKDADKQAEPPKAEVVPPKPKPVMPPPPPPPPPEPDLLEQLTSDPIYIGGAGLLALLGIGGYVVARRRRSQSDPERGGGQNDAGLAPQRGSMSPAVAVPVGLPIVDDVDPLAEADLYLNFGRDVQAEEVLKDALAKNPGHEEVKLKLLQIYAGRKDKALFETVAKDLFAQTGGKGEAWVRAAGVGYALDPDNAMYEAGRDVPQEQLPAAIATGGTDLDFDLELAQEEGVSAATKSDFELDADKTILMKPGELAGLAAEMSAMQSSSAESADTMASDATLGQELDISLDIDSPASNLAEAPDLVLDIPGSEEANSAADNAEVAASSNMIDFNFDAAEVVEPATPVVAGADFRADETIVMTPEMASSMSGNVDFELGEQVKSDTEAVAMPDLNLDVPVDQPEYLAEAESPALPALNLDDISLNFEVPQTGVSVGDTAVADAGPKDDHWYDVQTKFDLAKAYQEMGDKDGAIEILREVIKDGDVAQQAEANALLESLS